MSNKKNKKDKQENGDIEISESKSSLVQFTRRPVPSEKEVEQFDEYIEKELQDEEVNESLNEIYQDESGEMVDVKKMEKKKKRGYVFWIFSLIFFIVVVGGGYYVFQKFIFSDNVFGAANVEFEVITDETVVSGEEVEIELMCNNKSNVGLKEVEIEVKLPENLSIISTEPELNDLEKTVWKIDYVPARSKAFVKIKGILVGSDGDYNPINSVLTYYPENFSSEFKKDAFSTIMIGDIGMNVNFDYASSALIGEEVEVDVNMMLSDKEREGEFRIVMSENENVELLDVDIDAVYIKSDSNEKGVWRVNFEDINEEASYLPIRLKFKEKKLEKEVLNFRFEQRNSDGEYVEFFEEKVEFEVMKSDLNLSLIINGAASDQGVNFGETLHYTISYKNKGEAEMTNVVLMAVLRSDYLNWTTLQDEYSGREKGNTITWTKAEIPELELLGQDSEGEINFSIDMLDAGSAAGGSNFQVESFVQFSLGEMEESEDNKSNTIVNRINSDLKLNEKLKYFNGDDTVGTGPHPPMVDKRTSYKVYWEIENNLHELNDLVVEVKLPDYVTWNDKSRASISEVDYNDQSRIVRWNIGRLPNSVYKASAEFSVAIRPEEKDAGKIMIILPGTKVEAMDVDTDSEISTETRAKTTILEDDEVVSGDGMVKN